jgi:hypothetical protein
MKRKMVIPTPTIQEYILNTFDDTHGISSLVKLRVPLSLDSFSAEEIMRYHTNILTKYFK